MKLIFFYIQIILFIYINTNKVYDSYLNIYKENQYYSHAYKEIANTTWKEFFISENVKNLIKCNPVYIDNDKELDLLVLDSESRLYWVSNIRGTSKEVKHQFISSSKLHDFVISNKINNNNPNYEDDNFILGINSKRDKILKFKIFQNTQNFTKSWRESDFLDINDENLVIKSLIKNSDIISIHLSQFENEENKQLLLVGLKNYYDYSINLLKIIIKNEKIDNIDLIKFKNEVRIIGAYDMNKDGLIDILYIDNNNSLFVMINDDPYYWHVFISYLNTAVILNTPRLFIIDSDRDGYPDIITMDKTQNTVGILFNKGPDYWEEIKHFYKSNQNREKIIQNGQWTFIPLIDVYEEGLSNDLIIDFTVMPISTSRRINFEIFTIYENNLYWFVEKELPSNVDNWGSHKMLQNYMYCMTKCDIVVDQQSQDKLLNYKFLLDVDVNVDSYPEFIIYSDKDTCLYLIKKYEPNLTGFGWNSNFWIYLIVYIYIVSSIIGILEFYKLKKLNDNIRSEKLLKINDISVKPVDNLYGSEFA